MRLLPCLAGLLPDISHSGSKNNYLGGYCHELGAIKPHLGAIKTHLGAIKTHLGAINTHLGGVCQNYHKILKNLKWCAIPPMPAPYPPRIFTKFWRNKNPCGRIVSSSGSTRSRLGSILLIVGSNQNTFGRRLSFLGRIPPFLESFHIHLQSNHENGWRSGRIV
jgi:hypothetical protein